MLAFSTYIYMIFNILQVAMWMLNDVDDEDDEDDEPNFLMCLSQINCFKEHIKTQDDIMFNNLCTYHIISVMMFRMNQRIFQNLCKMLAKRYELQEMNNIYIKERVAMFLEVVGQNKVMVVL